jgi:hypothetical protein
VAAAAGVVVRARAGRRWRRPRGSVGIGGVGVEQAVEASESYNGDEERAQVVGVGVLPAVRGEDGDGCGLSSGVVLHIVL